MLLLNRCIQEPGAGDGPNCEVLKFLFSSAFLEFGEWSGAGAWNLIKIEGKSSSTLLSLLNLLIPPSSDPPPPPTHPPLHKRHPVILVYLRVDGIVAQVSPDFASFLLPVSPDSPDSLRLVRIIHLLSIR